MSCSKNKDLVQLYAFQKVWKILLSKISQEMIGFYAGMADFGRLVSSISTRGGRLWPPYFYLPPQIFRPSAIPVMGYSKYIFSLGLDRKGNLDCLRSSSMDNICSGFCLYDVNINMLLKAKQI